ncbi:hypothetical protein [Klenkia brasiliensis]|uniref:hypothetical protein n=1 Tax=Klenkia brasiliensis TaxID=333142 RepID=UPI000B821F75|nr:hypothetical protein [Klenkia brasiliensis]
MSYLPDPATVSRHGEQEVAGQTRFVATGAPDPHVHRTSSEHLRGMVELRADGRVPTTEELDELAARYDQLNLRD